MLHTFWVTEVAFDRIDEYTRCRDSAQLYIMYAQHDLTTARYVLLVECSDSDATWLQLLAD